MTGESAYKIPKGWINHSFYTSQSQMRSSSTSLFIPRIKQAGKRVSAVTVNKYSHIHRQPLAVFNAWLSSLICVYLEKCDMSVDPWLLDAAYSITIILFLCISAMKYYELQTDKELPDHEQSQRISLFQNIAETDETADDTDYDAYDREIFKKYNSKRYI